MNSGGAGPWPLLVLVGPTAVGKTATAVEVARRLGAEVISGDSVQVYRGLDIGTAKPTWEEQQGIPHHLIDIADPDQPVTAAVFRSLVADTVGAILARGHLPLLTGGTGFYIRSALGDVPIAEVPPDPALREEARSVSDEALWERLGTLDPGAAERLHPHDRYRVVRAIEVALAGHPGRRSPSPYDALLIGLQRPREELYRRIDHRVEAMIAAGWPQEVLSLIRQRYQTTRALSSLGYRELRDYLHGRVTMQEAVRLIQRNTRRFAKRQDTWWRKEAVEWIPAGPEAANAIVEAVRRHWPQGWKGENSEWGK